jgi:uncharacterized protein YqeY
MLKEKIERDLKESLKERREIELSVLRMLKAGLVNKEKEKRYNISREKPESNASDLDKESLLSDEEIISFILSEIKKGKKAILDFEKGKREDLVEKEKKEIDILKAYLPQQLSEEEVIKIIKEAVEKTGAKDIKDIGKVMAEIMLKTKGKADNSLVSKIVKEMLCHDRD